MIWNLVPYDLKQLSFNRVEVKYKKHLLSKYKRIFQPLRMTYILKLVTAVNNVFKVSTILN